jgi:hypothetical protein
MAIVADEYTRWPGHTGQGGDMGRLIVWAESTGQRPIDRVEIDNTACSDVVRVVVTNDDGQVMFDQIVQPGESYTDTQARGVRWNRNTQAKIGQWLVSTATWAP